MTLVDRWNRFAALHDMPIRKDPMTLHDLPAPDDLQPWRRWRMLRGRVLVREIHSARRDAAGRPMSEGGIYFPENWIDDKRNKSPRIHRGEVLAIGAPARTKRGHHVILEAEIGQVVWFVFALATEEFRAVGSDLTVVAQEEVIAVEERS